MSTWKEQGEKGNKKKKPKETPEINSSKTLRQEIRKQKEKQRQLLKSIRDEVRKIEQLKISIEGIEKLSKQSIDSIQNRREKSIIKAKKSIAELTNLVKELSESEKNYQKSLK